MSELDDWFLDGKKLRPVETIRSAKVDSVVGDMYPEAPKELAKYLAAADKHDRENVTPDNWLPKHGKKYDYRAKVNPNYDYGDGLKVSETGGQKAEKPSKIGYLDPTALMLLGEVAGMSGPGKKYPMHNFLKGFDWSLSFNALQRHALQFWAGEDLDPESGLPHMAHVAWHALALVAFLDRGIGKDDRPKKET